jgi:hypothetical protein
MKLKTILTFVYLCTSVPVFLFFKAELLVWISFFINFLLITGITYFHLNLEKTYSPFLTSFIVFFYLFGIVAPIIQISSFDGVSSPFPTNFPYNSGAIIHANFLIFIFCSVFFLVYVFLKKTYKINSTITVIERQTKYSTPLVILVLFLLCVIIVATNFNYLLEDITKSIYDNKIESVFSLLLKKKVLFYIPLGAIGYTLAYLKRKNKINTNTLVAAIILLSLVFILFFFKNPLTEKRNALGPIYIALIYIFKPKLINTNSKFFLFMFLSLVILFPLMSTFTHMDGTIFEVLNDPYLIVQSFIRFGGISTAFSSLHYDAFANIMASVDFVNLNGLSFGYQLLGTIFFFIPRGIWTLKPMSTGELVGNHLIENHGFSFSNLSNSIVSEGYINFGFLGVVLFAIVLSYFVIFFMSWMKSGDFLKEIMAFYFAVHLIFLLRGDLANGLTYYVGPLIASYFIPKIIESLLTKRKR